MPLATAACEALVIVRTSVPVLHVDIPTKSDLTALASRRDEACVSLYLPTTPLTQDAPASRIQLKNLASEAIRQLTEAGTDKRRVRDLEEEFDDLVDDDEFWRFQAHGLAVFATPDNARTFRVPTALSPAAEVADRFHLKPLLRAVSFPNSGWVLALAGGAVRLVEVSADLPATTVMVDGLPKDVASVAGKASIKDRSPSGRLQGAEGQKVRLRQYARRIDAALRPLLAGCELPVILAGTDPIVSIYRSVNTYPYLAPATLDGSPDTLSDAQLAERARSVLDDLYRGEIAGWRSLFGVREPQGRTTTDLAGAARAATMGAVDSLLIDIDGSVSGIVDETSGAVIFAEQAGAGSYDVVDEVARRVIRFGGQVLGVRSADIPGGGPLAAILRYPA